MHLLDALGPPVTLVVHGLSDLDEASNVGTGDERGELALLGGDVLLSGSNTVIEGILHDSLELVVDLLGRPGETAAVLGHLETRNGDTTAVSGLSGGVPEGVGPVLGTVSLENVDGLLGGSHVGALGEDVAAVLDQVDGLLLADLVLGGAGEGDVDLADVGPGADASDVLGPAVGLELDDGAAIRLERDDGVDIFLGEGSLAVDDDGTLGVGEGEDGGAELEALEGGVLGDVTGAGDGDALAGHGALTKVLEHEVDVVDETVASSLCREKNC